ncbi:MAG: tetratricopeptide repeat protein, partial [Myxococcota bacterium]
MRSLTLLVIIALAGCAKKATVGDETTPRPGARAPQRQLSHKEKAELGKALAAYEQAQKDGMTPERCAAVAEGFGEVADDNPKLIEARFNQGAVFEQCGEGKAAMRAYLQALDANGSYAPALAAAGRLTLRGGDEGRAYEYFDRAAKADPKNAEAYLGLAMVLRERARRGDAQAAKDARNNLRRALAVDAYNMDAYTTLALLEYDLAGDDPAKLDMARLVTDQGKKLRDSYAPIYNVGGLISLKRNNVTAALAQFKKAAELDPSLLEAHMNIGAITLNFRDYGTAEASFRHVIASQPKNFDALIGLGVALRGLQKVDEAERYYKEAGKADPNNAAVTYNLGVLYQDYLQQTTEQLNKARSHFQDFIARSQDKAKVEDAKARIKNIEDTFKAIEEAKKMQAEMEKMQKEMQKELEDQQKLMQQQQQPAPAPAPAPEGAAPAPAPAPAP